MRLKYYKLTLRQMSFKKPFVFFLTVVIVMTICMIIFSINVRPKIKMLCDSTSQSLAMKCTNNAVLEFMENIKYTDLINIQKDDSGKIIALNANVIEMNKISSKVANKSLENFSNVKDTSINLPLASFIGIDTFGGYGPNINISVVPISDVKAGFVSEFESTGINQTRHRIYIELIMDIRTITPFSSDSQKYVNQILVAETVLLGDIPSSYYNIEGIKDLKKNDTLDLIE